MALTKLTLNQLAALAKPVYRSVVYINDASLTDIMYTIEGSPDTLIINLATFYDLPDKGGIKGAAIDDAAIDTADIAAGALAATAAGRAKMATDYFDAAAALDKFGARTIPTSRLENEPVDDPGHLAMAMGRIVSYTARAAGPVDGDVITIGADVFEIDDITAVSGDLTILNNFNVVTDPLVVPVFTVAAGYANLGVDSAGIPVAVGDLLFMGVEYLRVLDITGTAVTFGRARCGTAAAAHVAGVAIFRSVAPGTANIAVGTQAGGGVVAVAVGTPLLVATINDNDGTDANDVTAESLLAGAELLLAADDVGGVALATLAVTVVPFDFVWDGAIMDRGEASGRKRMYMATVWPTVGEAAAGGGGFGEVNIPLPFDAYHVMVMLVPAAGAVYLPFVGSVVLLGAGAGLPARATVTGIAASPLLATDNVILIAFE